MNVCVNIDIDIYIYKCNINPLVILQSSTSPGKSSWSRTMADRILEQPLGFYLPTSHGELAGFTHLVGGP